MNLPNNKTLELIKNERVFEINEHEGKLYLLELCDEHFAVELTKEMCEDLAQVFRTIAEEI